jgi:hypothetical protein
VTAPASAQPASNPAPGEGEPAARARELLADAGAILAPRRAEWAANGLRAELAAVDDLISAIDEVDDWIAVLEHPTGSLPARLLQARRSRARRARLELQRQGLATRLHGLLVRIAEEAPAQTVPDADRLRAEAVSLRVLAADRVAPRPEPAPGPPVGRSPEPAPSPGPTAEQSPEQAPEPPPEPPPGPAQAPGALDLGAHEVAVLTVEATIRRRGTAHAGTLVLTTGRLAFVEQSRSFEIPLGWIRHAQVDRGDLLVYQAQRATPFCFTVSSPRDVLRILGALLGGR